MREIKFRAWDGDLEEYIDYTGLDIPVESLNNSNIIIWEQFTGLYDATKWKELTEDERTEWTRNGNMPSEWKGKEIYVGDICHVKYHDKNERCDYTSTFIYEYNGVVVLEDGCFQIKANEQAYIKWFEDYKVIGNIHENPELLKGE